MKKSFIVNIKLITVLIFLFNSSIILNAQSGREGGGGGLSLRGKVTDDAGKALRGASVQAVWLRDSTSKKGAITDRDGKFSIDGLRRGEHRVEVSFVGFERYIKSINLSPDNNDIGTLKLKPGDVRLGEITVEGEIVRQEQREDTTIYNADAFKVNPDATTEDLLKKMPGVTVERDGTVQAQGENIRKVLIDGKEFFGDDPTVAIKSLPAEIIDKIQVFDQASDQAQFTGFDDGNSQKTLNIITKSDKGRGNFGKLYAGYGTDDRYWGGGNVNYFQGDMRLSVIGLTNNINQQNFAVSDVLSATGASAPNRPSFAGARGPGRGGGSARGMGSAADFLTGQQNGISTTNSIGLNYSDRWSEGMTFTGSYFFNLSNNDNVSLVARNFFVDPDAEQMYNETNAAFTDNFNHRLNARFDYQIDSSHSILFTPRINFQANDYNSNVDGITSFNSVDVNRTENDYQSDLQAFSIDNSLLYRYKFAKKGRTFSMQLSNNVNKNSGNTYLLSNNTIFDVTAVNQFEFNQDGDILGDGYRLNSELNYTEPITEFTLLQFSYNPSYTVSNSDKEVYNLQPGEENFRFLDTMLTNNFENIYFQQRGGLSMMYNKDKTNITLGMDYQAADLQGRQVFPFDAETNFTFGDFLPNLRIQHNLSKTTNIRFNYRTSTSAPSLSQLQNVVDNSNPVLLRAGNQDLKQNYTHTIMTRFGTSDFRSSSFLFAFGMLRFTNDYIANSLLTARRDTVIDNIPLFAGSQLSRPVNLDGYVNGRLFAAFGRPVPFLKSNFNIRSGVVYSKTPGLINDRLNEANNFSINSGVVLSSNISQNFDFTLSYSGNYTIVENSLLPEQNNNYFIHVANGSVNWILWGKLVLNTELFHNLYKGLEQEFDQEFILWNASIGFKFLENNAAELRLSVYDILGQNNSITRNVTEIYLEDLRTQVLQRYFMLTITYNLRRFG
ncbi:MAG: TonB-dependent receptor [Candidatus Kapabacteria bacterium]|nr:TonB-dependent receptor [Ignavibacteriota bacterium]MCW5886095.1 TonB-dependent receptor [Candidatus Kapabacteria bacterium]